MDFGSSSLRPNLVPSGRRVAKWATFQLPFTAEWNDGVDYNNSTLVFKAYGVGIPQYRSRDIPPSGWGLGYTAEVFPGVQSYLTSTVVVEEHYYYGDTVGPSTTINAAAWGFADTMSGPRYTWYGGGSLTVTGDGSMNYGAAISVSATNVEGEYGSHTLSNPVTEAFLRDGVTGYLGLPENQRGLASTHSGYGAFATETPGGIYGEVWGGHFNSKATGISPAYGMVGDQPAMWNGNFTLNLEIVTRKNGPSIYAHPFYIDQYRFSTERSIGVGGLDVFNTGTVETELTGLNLKLLDEYSVYALPPDVEDVPFETQYDLSFLLYYSDDEGKKTNELLTISGDGKRYRVTFESGHYDTEYSTYSTSSSTSYGGGGYGYNYTVEWTKAREYVAEMDPVAFRDAVVFGPDADADTIIVTKVEVYKEDAEHEDGGEWIVLADLDVYTSDPFIPSYTNGEGETVEASGNPIGIDPQSLIGTDPRYYKILAILRKRNGEPFGHRDFTYSEDRYLKKSHRRNMAPGHAGLSGVLTLEYEQEYDEETGELLDRKITAASAITNGVDWTPDGLMGFSEWEYTTQLSATHRKQTYTFTSPADYSYYVKFDHYPLGFVGKRESATEVALPVSFDGLWNVIQEQDLTPPEAGKNKRPETWRASYD